MPLCILCEKDYPSGVCPIHGYLSHPIEDESLSVTPSRVDEEQVIDAMIERNSAPSLATLFTRARLAGVMDASITVYGEGQGKKPTS